MNDEEQPRAHRADPIKAGGCNACAANLPTDVWVIRLRSMEVRLCHYCAESLIKQLRR